MTLSSGKIVPFEELVCIILDENLNYETNSNHFDITVFATIINIFLTLVRKLYDDDCRVF